MKDVWLRLAQLSFQELQRNGMANILQRKIIGLMLMLN